MKFSFPMRLNQYISLAGVCSRRGADRLIQSGEVSVNGDIASLGRQVGPFDLVSVSGVNITLPDRLTAFAYYKPKGIVCTSSDPHIPKEQTLSYIIENELDLPVKVFYSGRLDKDTEGLLILTNDGILSQNMMRGALEHEKEYIVTVDKKPTKEFFIEMASGIYLEELDITTRPCRLMPDPHDERKFTIILTQGLNRQIRRMCFSLGYLCTSILRTRILNIKLGDMVKGECRELEAKELEELYRLTSRSL